MSFFPYSYKHTPIDYGLEVRGLWRDKQKRLWVASKKGTIRIYAPDGQLQGYLNQQGTISKDMVIFPDNIYCFMEDKDGIIWMGGKEKGLFRLEKKDETHFSIQQFTNQPENKYSLSNNSVYSICQDSHNRIWIGCFGGGINLLTKSTDGKIRFI